MNSSSIVLFGKPNSFEAFGIAGSQISKLADSFIEPEIKVSKDEGTVLRFFIRDGYSYLQLYSFALANQSGREGIVIGAAIRSRQLIALSKGNVYLLTDILNLFKSRTLNGFEFITSSLEHDVQQLRPELEELTSEVKYRAETIPKVHDQTLLLCLPDIARISELKEEINLLKDIYIAADKNVFTSLINKKILYQTGDKFYTLGEGDKIIEYAEPAEVPFIPDLPFLPSWENGPGKPVRPEREGARSVPPKKRKEPRWMIAVKAFVCLSLAAVLFFAGYLSRHPEVQQIVRTEPQHDPEKVAQETLLPEILSNPVTLDTLSALCNNIKTYLHTPSHKQRAQIRRRAQYLNLDTTFVSSFPKPQPVSQTVKTAPKPAVKPATVKKPVKAKVEALDSAHNKKPAEPKHS